MKYKTTFISAILSLAIFQSCKNDHEPAQAVKVKDSADHITYVDTPDVKTEWKVYKDMAGFGAYRFAFSERLKRKNYEVKILTFKNGVQTDSIYFDKNRLFRSFLLSSGPLPYFEFYSYRQSDTEELFRMSPNDQADYIINLHVEGSRNNYRWTPLHNANDSSKNIEINKWYAIATFSQQPHTSADPEKCVYCMLPDYKIHYDRWFEKFGVAHYYIILLRLVD